MAFFDNEKNIVKIYLGIGIIIFLLFMIISSWQENDMEERKSLEQKKLIESNIDKRIRIYKEALKDLSESISHRNIDNKAIYDKRKALQKFISSKNNMDAAVDISIVYNDKIFNDFGIKAYDVKVENQRVININKENIIISQMILDSKGEAIGYVSLKQKIYDLGVNIINDIKDKKDYHYIVKAILNVESKNHKIDEEIYQLVVESKKLRS